MRIGHEIIDHVSNVLLSVVAYNWWVIHNPYYDLLRSVNIFDEVIIYAIYWAVKGKVNDKISL